MNNTAWSRAIVQALVAHGYREFALCPGSRSTSLTVAVAQNPECTSTMHYDERGQAFFALGYARATGRPLPLICTSGSAVANFFPAVVEASNDRVPMLMLTTDRPPELQECGSNQTINQRRIFGEFSRYLELPCPGAEVPVGMIQSTLALALRWARTGPVQLNIPYRKPFEPDGSEPPTQRLTEDLCGRQHLSEEQVEQLLLLLDEGLLVVGQLRSEAERDAVEAFSRRLGWPVFADVLSGLPGAYYDLLLRHEAYRNQLRPKTVLHLGGQFVSMPLLRWLKGLAPSRYIHVEQGAHRLDPNHQVTHRVQCDMVGFCEAVGPFLSGKGVDRTQDELVDATLTGYFSEHWGEMAAARQLTDIIGENEPFYVASSLSIRHVDVYGLRRRRRIAGNRGTSGIDGTIATASGYSAGTGRRATVLMGDLAFLHDLNSLAFLRERTVQIVLLNNDGGAIFSGLPIRKEEALFERYFQTPHGLNARHAAEMFGLRYAAVDRADQFEEALDTATLIEVQSSVASYERQRAEVDQLIANQLTLQTLGARP